MVGKYKPISFKLKTKLSDKYFRVLVFDNVNQMRSDYKESRLFNNDDLDFAGLCSGYEKVLVSDNGEETVSDDIGEIRLAKTKLSSRVIAHELIHAALQLFRSERKSVNFKESCDELEEEFALLYGEMTRRMILNLYRTELWK